MKEKLTQEQIYDRIKIAREVAEHLKDVEFDASYALGIEFINFCVELNNYIDIITKLEAAYKPKKEE